MPKTVRFNVSVRSELLHRTEWVRRSLGLTTRNALMNLALADYVARFERRMKNDIAALPSRLPGGNR